MLGECGSDLHFPRARAPEYSAERGSAYLLSSEWVQEFPDRYGRHAHLVIMTQVLWTWIVIGIYLSRV